jgi:hypothetical protein
VALQLKGIVASVATAAAAAANGQQQQQPAGAAAVILMLTASAKQLLSQNSQVLFVAHQYALSCSACHHITLLH